MADRGRPDIGTADPDDNIDFILDEIDEVIRERNMWTQTWVRSGKLEQYRHNM
ncbi:hypothetical protein Brsp01_26390 [Brucella sp. NBRC 12950]|nr:hypothetical protein Brsp01_26390 [Brucella sp. NBRC 12950]